MLTSFPTTKTYFLNFDMSPGSPQIQTHSKKAADALTKAIDRTDNMPATLSDLSDCIPRSCVWRPTSGGASSPQLLNHYMLLTRANNFPEEFTLKFHTIIDKLFCTVGTALSSKYHQAGPYPCPLCLRPGSPPLPTVHLCIFE
ncbi:Hemoglobin subunit alpha-1/2/3 [Heterocephalus glaber]|uniref:Hemoglobin subunit alpha-1/2/3 n=1 Tax=Heterocephalus glaber TaxID=10181 RepID=G5BXY4_HETGA|nr:Hemoglobin subunit alpha-1/2/3 [Heterocephalus glaber]